MTAAIACPSWCNYKHKPYITSGENPNLHRKTFGVIEGAWVEAWVIFSADGHIKDSGFLFNIEESTDPEDMEEVAGWCTAAAAFMREIRRAMVSA